MIFFINLWVIGSSVGGGRWGGFRNRSKEILFIDARDLGYLINRRTCELSPEDIARITGTYHAWRNPGGSYEDVPGFCCAASIERVRALDFVLTPGRYVGLPDEEDDFDFNERFMALRAELEEQMREEERLNRRIVENLSRIQMLEGK
ncbi:MAG: N-6 DNA methylase [Saprospirales bacterium]|nr:N-6 DNA methylase [Saprospirales bacterium]MBK8921883.1 N-6 DNA methylase [Saprospirales bacterium]